MNTTIKLYDELPYEISFQATVLDVVDIEGRNAVVLDKTLFFPEEGGQTPDRGVLNIADKQYEVVDVQIVDDVIYHYVRADSALNKSNYDGASNECVKEDANTKLEEIASELQGAEVQGEIDWQHRFSNMQQHTGEHIFSGLAHELYGCTNVGFHLSDTEVTFDYDIPLDDKAVRKLEREVNRRIQMNLEVKAYYPDESELSNLDYRSKKEIDGAVRIVEIQDTDLCACCAPHVRRTGEVGLCKVVSTMSYKGGTRISILCGARAMELFYEIGDTTGKISRVLSASRETLAEELDAYMTGAKDTKLALGAAQNKYIELLVPCVIDYITLEGQGEITDNFAVNKILNEYLISDNWIILHVDGLDENHKRYAINDLKEHFPERVVGIVSENSKGYSFILASIQRDCKEIATRLREELGAKGGGSSDMIQGSLEHSLTSTDLETIINS